MKKRRVAALALGAAILGGCATVTDERARSAASMADASAAPKESVAAERCSESYRTRSFQQGAFYRSVIC